MRSLARATCFRVFTIVALPGLLELASSAPEGRQLRIADRFGVLRRSA